MITVADVGDGKLRVCMFPEKKADGENAALTAPITTVATAAELDEKFLAAIDECVESFIPLNEQTKRIRAEREQAEKDEKAKAEDERKERAAKNAKKSGSTAGATSTQSAKPAATAPAKPAIPKMDDLFSLGSASSTPAPASEVAQDTTVGEEVLAGVGADDSDELADNDE
jgi:PRTRC genetic system protein E